MDTRVKRVGKSTAKRPYKHAAIKQPTWQNPFIEYLDSHRRHFKKPRRRPSRRTRLERQVLAMLAFFSLSIGLWENFRQLWLQQNGFAPADISTIQSLGMLLSVAGVLIVGKTVKMPNIKRFMVATLLLRSLNMLLLSSLNYSGQSVLIAVSVALDVVSGSLIITSVYPLLTTVMKSNHAYSRRKLVEYLFRDLGILVGGVLIGQQIGFWLVDYNACLMIALIFSVIASLIMCRFELSLTERAPQDKFSAIKYVLRSKTQRLYMTYVFLSATAYNIAVGLRMLVLTEYFSLSAGVATTFLLVIGLSADILGILALRYFTPKSDYASISIKVGTRFIFFSLAFLTGNLFICFLALAWTLLSTTVYENITDGYYINAVDNRHQLKYNTLRYVVNYAGDALGLFLSGLMFGLGVEYIFGLAGIFLIFALIVACRLIYERKHFGFRRS